MDKHKAIAKFLDKVTNAAQQSNLNVVEVVGTLQMLMQGYMNDALEEAKSIAQAEESAD